MLQLLRRAASVCFPGGLALLVLGCGEPSKAPTADSAADPSALRVTSSPVGPAELPDDVTLRASMDEAITFNRQRHLSAETNAAWQVVHGLLAYGPDLTLEVQGKPMGALDWLLNEGELNGWKLQPGDHGLEALTDPGSKTGQGHEDQWLGYLALRGVPLTQPIKLKGVEQAFTLQDLLSQAQWDLYEGMEATWTLMACATYLAPDATWKAKDGNEWTLERMAVMEAENDLAESACGGSHRLCGLVVALQKQDSLGQPRNGNWQFVAETIENAVETVRRSQNADGTFSADYFVRPASSPDVATQISTTGHTLEFLAYALPDHELAEPWVTRATARLCKLLSLAREMPLECGGLYHAVHGLALYRERRFGSALASRDPSR